MKQLVFLPTSLCAADTTESESDLKELFQTCELSLTVRSKLMQLPTLLRKWKRDKWMKLLFSRTSRHFRIENLVVGLPCSVQDSLVNHLAVQVNAKQQKTQDTCTRGSQMELQLCDHDMSSSKMLKESSQLKQQTENLYLNMSSETWKKEVTRVRGEYSVRLKSVHHTKENECSSWPTVTVAEAGKIGNQANYGQVGLSNHPAIVGTPQRAKGVKDRKKTWPTPRETMSRDVTYDRGKSNLGEVVHGIQRDLMKPNTSGKYREQLSSEWVEQLMGLPTGWTDLGSWVTE